MTTEKTSGQFLDVLEKNIGILMKISRAYSKTIEDRKDLVNDIVLELWKSWKNFREDSKISTWIYRVALNTSMNYRQKKKKDSLFDLMHDFKKMECFPWLTVEDHPDESSVLYSCIDELNEMNKALILLYLDGNSHEEISAITLLGFEITEEGCGYSIITKSTGNTPLLPIAEKNLASVSVKLPEI